MTHLDEGTLQAYLDDEIEPSRRPKLAEHVMACRECRSRLEELRSAAALFATAMTELDTAAPTRETWRVVEPEPERSATGRSFVRAAGLVLLLTAAASAAVPGSPVREWIVGTFDGPGDANAPTVEAEGPAAETEPLPAGIALSEPGDQVVVEVTGLEGGTIRLIERPIESVAVRSAGARRDPTFRTGSGRIEVMGGVGGELTVEWPSSLESARLEVNGRLYAIRMDGALRVLVKPQEESADVVVWR